MTLLLAACGREPATDPSGGAAPLAELAIAEARCLACHPADAAVAARLAPLPAPVLDGIGARVARSWLEGDLVGHFAADEEEARDLAHFLRGRTGARALEPAAVGPAELALGEALWGEAGCVACHPVDGIDGLAAKTDLDGVRSTLREPRATRPDLKAHDFGLGDGEARALAAWLLRAQRVGAEAAPPVPGIAWECFELRIDDAGLPELDGLVPTADGRAETIGVEPRTRDNHFVLRFTGSLRVPASGEWRFVTGSDDSSWLWIDGDMVVRNEGLAPHRRRDGRVRLGEGWHDLRVVYTEAGGDQSLEVLWEGPGVELQPIPMAAMSSRTESLVPPEGDAALEPVRVERGARAFVARRCGACHPIPEVDASSPAPAWGAIDPATTPCPVVSIPDAASALLETLPSGSRAPEDELGFLLARDGCLSCHERDGAGGLREAAAERLVEVEDLGDEGRLPPDLTRVGHRLRRAWIEGVLGEGRDARPYLTARMPRVSKEDAALYAELFAAVDAEPGDDVEPEFSLEAAAEGRRIVGSGGFACVACHRVAGHASLGPQGMDLAIQHERLEPAWFREWLLRPAEHRPGTRMPTFWPIVTDDAVRQVDAVRVWSSLGSAMPLPAGVGGVGSEYVLAADGDRPRLHGAFLEGLSAKCVAVGTPERTHYAYDLAHQRLAWLWRGAFLSAEGTWSGRAGKLLTPLGEDWVLLPEGCPFELQGGDAAPRMLGRRMDPDGYPIWRIGLGDVVVEDHPRPRWTADGSEMVRTVTARGGAVKVRLPEPGGPVEAVIGGRAVPEVRVDDGASIEVVYRW